MKKIKIGILGAGRGIDIAQNLMLLDCEIVALCDFNEKRRNEGIEKLGIEVKAFDSFDDFIEYDMDAVVLANYFHEHAEFAIKALKAGKHVLSECVAMGTLAEGVALCRAVEESGKIYMIAENYPFTKARMEMRRLYQSGELGEILYGEGEYCHPI